MSDFMYYMKAVESRMLKVLDEPGSMGRDLSRPYKLHRHHLYEGESMHP